MSGMFEVLAATDSVEQTRQALVRAKAAGVVRAQERFASFVLGASSRPERDERLTVISTDINNIAQSVSREHGCAEINKVALAIFTALDKLACSCCDGGSCTCDADCEDCDCKGKKAKVAADGVPTGDSYTQESESLPSADASGLGSEGSPKIDKGNSGDVEGWSIKPIDVPSKQHPSETQDVTDKADYHAKDFDPDSPTRERVDIDTAIQPEHNVAPNTKTWTGDKRQTDPVTSNWRVLRA